MGRNSNDECEQLVATFFEEVVANGRVELLEWLAAAGMLDHSPEPSGRKPGRAGFVQHVEYLHSGAPDLRVRLDDLVADGSRVIVHRTLTGRHTGRVVRRVADRPRVRRHGDQPRHVRRGPG